MAADVAIAPHIDDRFLLRIDPKALQAQGVCSCIFHATSYFQRLIHGSIKRGLVAILGHDAGPLQFIGNANAQCFGSIRLPVGNVGPFRRLREIAEPSQDFIRIGMR